LLLRKLLQRGRVCDSMWITFVHPFFSPFVAGRFPVSASYPSANLPNPSCPVDLLFMEYKCPSSSPLNFDDICLFLCSEPFPPLFKHAPGCGPLARIDLFDREPVAASIPLYFSPPPPLVQQTWMITLAFGRNVPTRKGSECWSHRPFPYKRFEPPHENSQVQLP